MCKVGALERGKGPVDEPRPKGTGQHYQLIHDLRATGYKEKEMLEASAGLKTRSAQEQVQRKGKETWPETGHVALGKTERQKKSQGKKKDGADTEGS